MEQRRRQPLVLGDENALHVELWRPGAPGTLRLGQDLGAILRRHALVGDAGGQCRDAGDGDVWMRTELSFTSNRRVLALPCRELDWPTDLARFAKRSVYTPEE